MTLEQSGDTRVPAIARETLVHFPILLASGTASAMAEALELKSPLSVDVFRKLLRAAKVDA
jgi:hypothetical protein